MFSTDFFDAVGAWQNGWGEDQQRRIKLAEELLCATDGIPSEFKAVDSPCYRKRYLVKGELVNILLSSEWDEGICSWTTDQRYAERFKGVWRESAVTAAIFCCRPEPGEVVLNISALWRENNFVDAADTYRRNGGMYAKAIWNFRDRQGEVVLRSPLRRSEIVALSGISSPFEDLCNRLGIEERHRDELYRKAVENNILIELPRLVSPESAQRALSRMIESLIEKLNEHASSP